MFSVIQLHMTTLDLVFDLFESCMRRNIRTCCGFTTYRRELCKATSF